MCKFLRTYWMVSFFIVGGIIYFIDFAFNTPAGGSVAYLCFALPIIVGAYFLPWFACKNPRILSSLFIMNLFFGWTVIGWVACLAWGQYTPRELA